MFCAFALMVLLEIARSPSGAMPAFAREAIANHFAIFLDDRDDKSGVVVTHIYLLLGCAIPVWLEVFCRSPTDDRALSTFRAATGILLIGICDGAAAIVEEKFPKENFRVNREMRDEILVYDLFLTKFWAKIASKCRENCVKI